MKRAVAAVVALALAVCSAPLVGATEFKRKFNAENSAKSSFKDGIVTLEFGKPKDMCWTYVPDVKNLEFKFRVNNDKMEAEFDWIGINITSDGSQLLGQGTGLSTIVWRFGDGVNSRVVEPALAWDAAVVKEIHSGSLYDEKNPPPVEDFRFGYADWITFSLKKTGSSWDVKINGISIVKNRYKDFDKDMSRLLENKDKVTLTFFTSGTPGVLELQSHASAAAPESSRAAASSATKSNASAGKTSSTVSTAPSSAAGASSAEPGASSAAGGPSSETATSEPAGSSDLPATSADDDSSAAPVSGGETDSPSPILWILLVAAVAAAGAVVAIRTLRGKKQSQE